MSALASALMVAALANPSAAVEYDCQADKQALLTSDKGQWSFSSQDIERSQRDSFRWKFVASSNGNGEQSVTHDPGIIDMIGLGGTYTTIPIAPGQFAFATRKDSNCLFTELACGALITISDIDMEAASFSIVPTGSLRQKDDSREIFQLVMLGTCKKSGIPA